MNYAKCIFIMIRDSYFMIHFGVRDYSKSILFFARDLYLFYISE